MPTTAMIIAPLASLRSSLESLLTAAGFSVIHGAANITQVRIFLNSGLNPPDIVILDIWLPYKATVGLVQTLKDKRIEVILMGIDSKGQQIADEIGVPFLLKPFTKEDLITTIEGALKKGRKSKRK
jgi:DNA-binding NtrC family response regulator